MNHLIVTEMIAFVHRSCLNTQTCMYTRTHPRAQAHTQRKDYPHDRHHRKTDTLYIKAGRTRPRTPSPPAHTPSVFTMAPPVGSHDRCAQCRSYGCTSRMFSARLVSLQSSSALTSRLSLAARPSAWMKRLSS